MSGRREEEIKLENKINSRLKDAPPILTEYYYSLIGSGKSYVTTYCYINYILSFTSFIFDKDCPNNFYLKIPLTAIFCLNKLT